MFYITNGTTQDGFGARLHRAIHTMAFTFYLRDAYNLDVDYIHTPLSYEGLDEKFDLLESARLANCDYPHGDAYGEITRDGYKARAELWDQNVKYIGKLVTDFDLDIEYSDDYNKLPLVDSMIKGSAEGRIHVVKYLQNEFNRGVFNIEIVNTYRDEIRKRFAILDDDNRNIVLQVRRKDAYKFGSVRYLDDDYYLYVLKQLEPFKGDFNITVRTQRSNFNAENFKSWKVVYDDQEEDFSLFKEMVTAKVLVVGKSSFSIAAALLNKNIVVYPGDVSANKLSNFILASKMIQQMKNDGMI